MAIPPKPFRRAQLRAGKVPRAMASFRNLAIGALYRWAVTR
jgi:hypothetical protein